MANLAGRDTWCHPLAMDPRLPDPDLVRAFGRAVRAHFEEEVAKEREQAEARRAAVLPSIRAAVERARADGLCDGAWLFGSYAWGEPGERSDIDLLVENCADPFMVASRVGQACGRDVHVIEMSEAPPSLKERVLADGVPL
jgi:predicted nucleotidyltransferase